MRIDYTFRLPRCARGIIQRQRIPFIIRQGVRKIIATLGQQSLVSQLTDAITARTFAVLNIDHEETPTRQGHCLTRQLRKLGINQQHGGLTVFKDVTERASIQADIVCV